MKSIFLRPFYVLAVIMLFLPTGCSKAKSLYDSLDKNPTLITDTGPDKSGLKKRVLVLPILNQASISEKRLADITEMFKSHLEKDPNLLLEKSVDSIPSTGKMRSPRFGIIMDMDVAKKAEEMAVNVLVTVVLNPYEMRLKKVGIWPFRSTKKEVEVSLVVNALDLINGTLFLTNLESEKLDFKVDEYDEDEEDVPKKPEMPELDDKTFTRILSRLMDRQGKVIREALKNQPWTGRILSADANTIIISAGRRVGLSGGRVFEVFTRGEQIRSASGGTIYLLGPKIGEVKTAELMEDYASAQPLSGEAFKAGQVIRAKSK